MKPYILIGALIFSSHSFADNKTQLKKTRTESISYHQAKAVPEDNDYELTLDDDVDTPAKAMDLYNQSKRNKKIIVEKRAATSDQTQADPQTELFEDIE